jgi:ribosomal protein S18 acetylase RimI-like enzyme
MPTIRKINNTDQQLLSKLHVMQLEAYSTEAKIIGNSGLPPLKETLQDLINSNETFWGLFDEQNVLIASISFEIEPDFITISKLIVSPTYFRQGFGKALVLEVIKQHPHRLIKVATASKNRPARRLYECLGFKIDCEINTPEGIKIANYVLKATGS